ncbi:MAG: hypothetical protein SNJ82_07915, partial [Gemmataceae bacterium]
RATSSSAKATALHPAMALRANPLKAEVIALLSEAGALPAPQEVWERLVAILRKHGLKVPK